MATSQVKNLPNATVEILIDIPWSDVKTSHEKILEKVSLDTEIAGFRRGKAPKKLVEEKIDKKKIYEEVIKEVIPKAYDEAIKQHKIIPITSPKIELLKAKQTEDWQVKVTVALKPKVNLKNYKQKLHALNQSKVKIWTPGSNIAKDEKPKANLDEIINALFDEVEVEISSLLIEQETNRMLADLLDQTKQIGLTIEQYLLSKGKTAEGLKAEYYASASKNLTVEFALAEIADQEKITVTKEDIDKLLTKIEKPEEKDRLSKNSYYLAFLIRQQKTLDFLTTL